KEIEYDTWNVAPGITKEHAETSLYAAMKNDFNVHIAKTTENMEITLADELTSAHLDCEQGLPCLYIETVAENEQEKKIESCRAYVRGHKTNRTLERNYPTHGV